MGRFKSLLGNLVTVPKSKVRIKARRAKGKRKHKA